MLLLTLLKPGCSFAGKLGWHPSCYSAAVSDLDGSCLETLIHGRPWNGGSSDQSTPSHREDHNDDDDDDDDDHHDHDDHDHDVVQDEDHDDDDDDDDDEKGKSMDRKNREQENHVKQTAPANPLRAKWNVQVLVC